MKSSEGWYSNRNGTDEYGFSALPGGDKGNGGYFDGAGRYGLWWSATEFSASDAWRRSMEYNGERVGGINGGKTNLFSVRCVADN